MNKKINIGFVVLHYQVIEDTIQTVESICYNIDTDSYHIVIVDNASPNKTGESLLIKYEDNNKITVILSEKNEGFARGNNIGFDYLKGNYNPEFIVLLNNDVLFLEKEFYKKTLKEYNDSQFYILGPMILTADGKYIASPMRTKPITKEEIIFAIKEYKKNLLLNKICLWTVYSFFKQKKSRCRVKKNFFYKKICRQENVQIHGCCLIFSEQYIKRRDGLYNKTFLYCEEDILFLEALKNKYKIVYLPDIKIYHKEDMSTDYIYKSTRKKNIAYYTEALKSEKILLDLYKEYESLEK